MKAGTNVQVIVGEPPFFYGGDFAVLADVGETEAWADFNDRRNPRIYDDGIWCVNLDNIIDVTPPIEDPEETLP